MLIRRVFMDFTDEVDRPVLGFFVDAEDIFTDNAKENQLYGTEEIDA